ncbi:hypothetical protein Ade02nite_36170 [Paractinoplanes deccanensis]|uniref:DUF402 domain-containing protein n=1 Tax=Paractinoplanes deccanensis TaxID=113561 RepID=A0ABQ3Y4Q4_9ACTN|nr:DUF402 domain-containing protein [Actinoplanes deccanensis]GID74976.1 hypothetical protein Ade02nite_36170 [Actinoplanes deccanensis]
MWPYGTQILYRYGRDGRAGFVRTGRVIADDGDGLALWIGPGSPQIESVPVDGRPLRDRPVRERFEVERVRERTTWRGPGIVQFAPARGDWSVWWFFTGEGDFEGWYVNLESPRVRWAGGVDSSDRALDVVITPDRVARWKDEDEFAELTGRPGRWPASQAAGIHRTGEELIARAAAGEPPFDGRFTSYRPDPAWQPVSLPGDWDRPHLAGP